MANNIKLTLPAEPFSGQIVTFTAPCDCAAVKDGLVINGETYTVCDAMGVCVTGVGGAWSAGAQISVVLDCKNKKAYIQNAAVPEMTIGNVTGLQSALDGKAASSHNHSASDIKSGTFPVARGGTGKTSFTANRLLYPSASTTMAQLAFPTVAGSVLRQGTSGAPYWTPVDDLKSVMGAAGMQDLQSHMGNTSNPHNVTASQISVTEAVLNAIGESGNLSVDSVLTLLGNLMKGGSVLYQWVKSKKDAVLDHSSASEAFYIGEDTSIGFVYASSYTITDNGIKFVNPKSVTYPLSSLSTADFSVLESNYFVPALDYSLNMRTIYKGSYMGLTMTGPTGYDNVWVYAQYMSRYIFGTASSIVSSTDPNAYSNGYVDADGYTYTTHDPVTSFLPRLATGTYTGVSTDYSQACTVDIAKPTDFAPKLVLIFGKSEKLSGGISFVIGSVEAGVGFAYTVYSSNHTICGVAVTNNDSTVTVRASGYAMVVSSSSASGNNSAAIYADNAFNNSDFNYTYYFVG